MSVLPTLVAVAINRTKSSFSRCLYTRVDLEPVLSLSAEQVDELIRTGQLQSIQICGEERFDSREVSALIDTYCHVSQRRAANAK